MKNKKIIRIFTAFLAVMLCMAAFSMTAFAYVDETETEAEPETTAEETEETTEPVSLTPDGNLTLVDDLSGEQTEDKQFITVVTKSGNYFYLIIDRASDSENVYFLNMVDEADLLALIEDADGAVANTITTPAVTTQPEATAEPDTSEDTTTETETSGGVGGTLLIVLIVAALGGGAFYYFKILKPKQSVTGGTGLDEFDFEDEDESEYISEDEAADTEDEQEDEE